jgi:hypothetical protein
VCVGSVRIVLSQLLKEKRCCEVVFMRSIHP